MSNLREFTWSARVVQWLPLAGALAVARRSVPAAGLLLGWLLGYVVVKGRSRRGDRRVGQLLAADHARASRLRRPERGDPVARADALVARGRPAGDAAPRPRAGEVRDDRDRRRDGSRAARRASRRRAVSRSPERHAASGVRLVIRRRGQDRGAGGRRRHPPRRSPHRRREPARRGGLHRSERSTFYRVYRASAAFPDLVCEPRGVDFCELRAETLVTTRDHAFLDPSPPADAVYRIAVAANWLDETDRGDVFAISPPVAPAE